MSIYREPVRAFVAPVKHTLIAIELRSYYDAHEQYNNLEAHQLKKKHFHFPSKRKKGRMERKRIHDPHSYSVKLSAFGIYTILLKSNMQKFGRWFGVRYNAL